ncbi:MAG TPA: 50S ribosomal protein L11 methyltransferase [Thermoanaerobaculia bacterium]|nr:50S ribosomal protein L11 methyltransferase [Thermoanaerobaculia bacterium]
MFAYHRQLIADSPRSLAYRDALRRVVKSGDAVIDLGSGSGVLAFFAAEAGARRVYAIERGHMADAISLLVSHLGFADRIEVRHQHSREVELPERASVLVSETLGSFGLEEQIISQTIDARARLLTEDATIIPRRVALWLVPVELPDLHERHVSWWSKPRYGFDLSPIRVFASNTLVTGDITAAAYLARPARIIDVDLTTVTDPNVSGRASFEAERDGVLHGFGGWFDATLIEGITLANDEPHATCWAQVFLPLDEPVALTRGTRVEAELESHDGTAWRWRGRAGEREFDQTTWLSAPPCIK